jgi:hypothetical protein
MSRRWLYALAVAVLCQVASCGRVTTGYEISTPAPGVRIIGTTSRGSGPLSANFSDISAVLEDGTKEKDKKLILSGTNLEIDRIEWRNQHNAIICLRGGYTYKFFNYVTLHNYEKEVSFDMHFALREDCAPRQSGGR